MHTPFKRPFTYVLRDFYHKFEYFIILGGFSVGYFLRPYIDIHLFGIIMASLTIGYILGHLFWAKKWIEGQGK